MKPRKPERLAVLALAVVVILAALAMTRSAERIELMRVDVKVGDQGPNSITFWSLKEEGHYLATGDPELLQGCADWDGWMIEVEVEDIMWTDMSRVVRVDALERPSGFSVSSGIVK